MKVAARMYDFFVIFLCSLCIDQLSSCGGVEIWYCGAPLVIVLSNHMIAGSNRTYAAIYIERILSKNCLQQQ